MRAVRLTDLHMTNESLSYIDAMHAVLAHKGWITYSKSMLAGMTAAGFRFTVNRRLTGESATAYNWMAEHFLAADFIGITAGQSAGYHFDATFPLYQKHAVSEIKKTIDRGVGAVIWKDRFVIAAGYDDTREVLFISDGETGEPKPLSYGDFGCNASSYWYFQVFEDRISLDHMEVYKESLMQAISKWETHDPMLPEQDYACGRSAYDAVSAALQSGAYDREGFRIISSCYAAAKRDLKGYMSALESYWPQLRTAADHYDRLARTFEEVVIIAQALGSADQIEAHTVRLIELFLDAKQTEEAAIRSIKLFMRETIELRTNDIALR